MSRKYYIIFYVIIKGWILEVEALVVPSDVLHMLCTKWLLSVKDW